MKHVSILVPKGHFSLVNVEGSHQILSWANDFLVDAGNDPLFNLHLVGVSPSITQSGGLFTINPDLLLHQVEKTDLIILPAIHGDFDHNLKQNAELVPWLIKQHENGAEIVSFCIGSFFLAATGLLNERQCSTHWRFASEFRKMFPTALLRDDKILTEDRGIYTCGGAYSFTNLLMYLVEKYVGREAAIYASKTFMIDIERSSQSPFIMFSGQKEHRDDAVLRAQEYIEQNFQDRITVDELSEKLSLGRRTFERRFKKATSNTVVEYIQRVKVEAAKKHFESGRKTVYEVMYDIGYNDIKAFRDVFKRITGMSPIDYKNKYNIYALQMN